MKEHTEFLDRFFEKLFGKGVNADNILRRTIYIRPIPKETSGKDEVTGLKISEVIVDSSSSYYKVALKLSNGLIINLVEAATKEKDGSTYGHIVNPPKSPKLVDVLYGNVQILVL